MRKGFFELPSRKDNKELGGHFGLPPYQPQPVWKPRRLEWLVDV
jgi:hypothetical protein